MNSRSKSIENVVVKMSCHNINEAFLLKSCVAVENDRHGVPTYAQDLRRFSTS